MTTFVFWQNVLSIHQVGLLEALVSDGYEVILVTEAGLPADRKRLGWDESVPGGAEVVSIDAHQRIAEILRTPPHESVHIFSGLGAYPGVHKAFTVLVDLKNSTRSDMLLGIYLEPLVTFGVTGQLRLTRHWLRSLVYRRSVDFVLATGSLAVEQNRAFGSSSVFPYAYFVRDCPTHRPSHITVGRSHAFGFVGQLIPRKGVDLLLHALAEAPLHEWTLRIVGSGESGLRLKNLARGLGLDERVRWTPAVSNFGVRQIMAELDTLVVPSVFDGWGAVVNEAMVTGTPVVASSAVGASEMIRGSGIGEVFESGSLESLKMMLERRVRIGTPEHLRNQLADWCRGSISPTAGASYLAQIVDFCRDGGKPKPPPPWSPSSR